MLEREYWEGVFMAGYYKDRRDIQDHRLRQAACELYGQQYVGAWAVAPDLAGEDRLEVVSVNSNLPHKGLTVDLREPGENGHVHRSVDICKIMDIEERDDPHTIGISHLTTGQRLITSMLEMTPSHTIKSLFDLVGRKAVLMTGEGYEDVIIDSFWGPGGASGVDMLDEPPETPLFVVRFRYGKWIAHVAFHRLEVVDDWKQATCVA